MPIVESISARAREVILGIAAEHGCHAVVLYGSRAVGTARPDSDYDLLLVRAQGSAARDVRTVEGMAIDAFVYAEPAVDLAADPGMLRVHGGVILLDEQGFAARLLAQAAERVAAGPAALPDDEVVAIRVWGQKMLGRIREASVEARYRRVAFLSDLLPVYYQLRRKWYFGPRKALLALEKDEPVVWQAFAAALQPDAPHEAIVELVRVVIGEG